jgi:two-component system sensor histidine kinase VicK
VLLSFLLAKTMNTPIERLTDGARREPEEIFAEDREGSRDEIAYSPPP